MATYKELVYMCLDELKLVSDDSHFQEEHVIFLLDKYRAHLLRQAYIKNADSIAQSNYQTICVDLEEIGGAGECAGGHYLKSIDTIPDTLSIGTPRITSVDFFRGNFNYVSNERFKYVGENKYLKNEIYTTISPDKYLYIKSSNPQAYYLKKIKVTGIFEDSVKAAEMSCESSDDESCDLMDKRFPIEEGLIMALIQAVVQDLANKIYNPADNENNDTDDLSRIANYIARYLKKRREGYGNSRNSNSDDD